MKGLICKDVHTNTLITCQPLIESDNIKYEFAELPVIQERENMIGSYTMDEYGGVTVVYSPRQLSEIEKLQESIKKQEAINAQLMLAIAQGRTM